MSTAPRRRIEATIKIEADDWDEMSRALHSIRTDLAVSGSLPTSSVSGGYGNGWIITSSEDTSITHDSWEQALTGYLDELRRPG